MKKFLREAVKLAAFRAVYPLTYRLFSLLPMDKERVLFCEVRHGHLTDTYKPIVRELKRRGVRCSVFYIHNNKGGMGYLLRYLKLCTILPRFGTVFIDDTCNLFGAYKPRRGTKLIQTWHSCGAFKKWGYSIAGLSFGQEPEELDRYPAHSNYTLVTVSSEECIRHFDSAFGFSRFDKPSPVRATGVARTDWFFDKENIGRAFSALYEAVPDAKGKRVILYAPTYRGDADDAQPPEQFDIGRFMSGLDDDCVLLIKQHAFVAKKTEIPEGCRCFDVSGVLPIEQLLAVSDLLVTDYSSLIFEYSLFGRPMVFYAYDLDDFYDYRGFFYRYDNDFLPGEIVTEEDKLLPAVRSALGGGNAFDITAFRERFMGACDGRATQRICDYITDR